MAQHVIEYGINILYYLDSESVREIFALTMLLPLQSLITKYFFKILTYFYDKKQREALCRHLQDKLLFLSVSSSGQPGIRNDQTPLGKSNQTLPGKCTSYHFPTNYFLHRSFPIIIHQQPEQEVQPCLTKSLFYLESSGKGFHSQAGSTKTKTHQAVSD